MGFASHYANIALYIHIKSSDFFPVLIFCILLFPHPSSLSCLFLFIRSLLSLGTFIRQTCVQPLLCTQRCAVQQIGCSPCLQGVLSLDREPGSLLHVARACRCDGSQEAEAWPAVTTGPSSRKSRPFRWSQSPALPRAIHVLISRLFCARYQ